LSTTAAVARITVVRAYRHEFDIAECKIKLNYCHFVVRVVSLCIRASFIFF
jgi:hypothetical protein